MLCCSIASSLKSGRSSVSMKFIVRYLIRYTSVLILTSETFIFFSDRFSIMT